MIIVIEIYCLWCNVCYFIWLVSDMSKGFVVVLFGFVILLFVFIVMNDFVQVGIIGGVGMVV